MCFHNARNTVAQRRHIITPHCTLALSNREGVNHTADQPLDGVSAHPARGALMPAKELTNSVVAVRGEQAPRGAQPAAKAMTAFVGVTPTLSATGMADAWHHFRAARRSAEPGC